MTDSSFVTEARRKAIQATGLAFIPFGKAGAACLLVLCLAEVIHLLRRHRGGLWGWRRLRRTGERNTQPDLGPLLLALGAASVLFMVTGRWAWAILCQPFLADSAAALVGRAVGGPRLPGSRAKTYAGSAVFVVIALAVPLALGIPAVTAVWMALIGTLVEAYSPRGCDNLLVSLAGLLIWFVA